MDPIEVIKNTFPDAKEISINYQAPWNQDRAALFRVGSITFELPRHRNRPTVFLITIKRSAGVYKADVKNMDNEFVGKVHCRDEETLENLLREIYMHTQL